MSSETAVRIDVSPEVSNQLVSLDGGPVQVVFFVDEDATESDVAAVLDDLDRELEYAARTHPDAGGEF